MQRDSECCVHPIDSGSRLQPQLRRREASRKASFGGGGLTTDAIPTAPGPTTPGERKTAPALYRAITAVARAAREGHDIAAAVETGSAALLNAGFSAVDYLAVVDAATLTPVAKLDRPGRVLAAARLGAVRLIDNVAAFPP